MTLKIKMGKWPLCHSGCCSEPHFRFTFRNVVLIRNKRRRTSWRNPGTVPGASWFQDPKHWELQDGVVWLILLVGDSYQSKEAIRNRGRAFL